MANASHAQSYLTISLKASYDDQGMYYCMVLSCLDRPEVMHMSGFSAAAPRFDHCLFPFAPASLR